MLLVVDKGINSGINKGISIVISDCTHNGELANHKVWVNDWCILTMVPTDGGMKSG